MTKLEKASIRLCSERVIDEISDIFGSGIDGFIREFDDCSEMGLLAGIFGVILTAARTGKKQVEGIAIDDEEIIADLYRACEEFDDILNGRVCKPEKIRKGVEGS